MEAYSGAMEAHSGAVKALKLERFKPELGGLHQSCDSYF
jgi:hypothetical protein